MTTPIRPQGASSTTDSTAISITTPPRNRWAILAILMVGVSLIVLDSTIVSVSLPVIINDLGLNLTDAQWVSSLYSVVFAALLLLMGTLGDRFGRTTIFQLGLVLFAGASIIAAMAHGPGLLIFARGIQGGHRPTSRWVAHPVLFLALDLPHHRAHCHCAAHRRILHHSE